MRHALRHVGHVQRAGQAVQQAHRDQEQRRAREVERHVVQRCPEPRHARAVQQQTIGGDQQHFEEYEQVEEVARQEGAIEAHQLELEQRVEMRTAAVVAATRVEQRHQRHPGGERQHQRRQPVQHEHDAERRLPVAEQVRLDVAAARLQQEHDRHRQQGRGGDDADARREHGRAAGEQQQQRAAHQRQHDRHDDPVRHGRCPRPGHRERLPGGIGAVRAPFRGAVTSAPRLPQARRRPRGPSRCTPVCAARSPASRPSSRSRSRWR